MQHARYQIGKAETLFLLAIPAILSVLFIARHLPAVLGGELRNPDSYMRLARLRETLRLGSPVHEMMRDSSGDGSIVHWSHLLDTVLYGLSRPFALVMGPDAALHAAAVVFGPLNMALLGLALAWAIAPFSERRWLWLAPVAISFSPAIVAFGLVGVVHHHVACVTVAVMTSGWAARLILGWAPPVDGWRMGFWAGLGVWMTPETLPLSMLGFGALWITWLRQSDSRALGQAIGNVGLGLAATVLLAWLVNPPYQGYLAEDLDRVSVVFVVLAIAVAGTGLVIRALDDLLLAPSARLWWSLAAGASFAAIWAILFAPTLLGAQGAVSDEAARAMFGDIAEMAPIRSAKQWMSYLMTGSLATLALGALAQRRRWLILFYLTGCGIVLTGLGQMHLRFAAYPEALGAAMLPVLVTLCGDRVRAWPHWRQPLPRMATIILFVLLPFAAELSQSTREAHAETRLADAACPVSGLGPMLAPYAQRVILTDINRAPELQYRTAIITVGSLYHRNQAAFMRLRDAWRTTEAEAMPAAIQVARIEYVLFCRVPGRSALVKDLPTTTLLDRLSRNEPPAWLHQVASDPASGHVLYRVGS